MKANEVRELPVVVDVITAGQALGLSRSMTYSLARKGEFPIPLMKVGSIYRARRSDLMTLLGVSESA